MALSSEISRSEAEEDMYRRKLEKEVPHSSTCAEHLALLKQHFKMSENLVVEARRQSKALEEMAKESAKANVMLQQLIHPSSKISHKICKQVEKLVKNLANSMMYTSSSEEESEEADLSSSESNSLNSGYSSSTDTDELEGETYVAKTEAKTQDKSIKSTPGVGTLRDYRQKRT